FPPKRNFITAQLPYGKAPNFLPARIRITAGVLRLFRRSAVAGLLNEASGRELFLLSRRQFPRIAAVTIEPLGSLFVPNQFPVLRVPTKLALMPICQIPQMHDRR